LAHRLPIHCMRRAPLCAVLVVAGLLLGVVRAQDRGLSTIPTDIEHVVTGGRWTAAGRTGVYRVLVRTGGFDHVVSEAQVEWIATDTGEAQVIQSKTAPTGSWRLDNPRIRSEGKGWRVELEALETHFSPPMRGKWVVRLGGPGQMSATQVPR
jgi:hypothetical protein